MRLRAVLFDLDGTLIDSASVWRGALVGLMSRRDGGASSAAAFEGLRGLSAAEAVRIIGQRRGWPATDRAADVAWVQQQVRAAYLAGGVAWRDGALKLVASVRAAGVATGLVTSSGRQVVEAVLVQPRCPVFEVVVTGDEVVAAKPAPDPYLAAARSLQLRPSECVAIEDSASGVASAVAAGCAVVAVGPDASCPGGGSCRHTDTLWDISVVELSRLQRGHVRAV